MEDRTAYEYTYTIAPGITPVMSYGMYAQGLPIMPSGQAVVLV